MEYKIIDTHCHPQFLQFDGDREQLLLKAAEKQIGIICVGTDAVTSTQAVALAERYEGLYASIGIHPTERGELPEHLARHPKVVAIGECGLDYYRDQNHEGQLSLFRRHLTLAEMIQKPIIVHCRDAHDDMIRILRERSLCGVVHSYNGSEEQAGAYLDAGYYIGLNGIMTFSKDYIPMLRFLPPDRILLETDAPYLAPHPHRGERNSPLNIEAVGNYIATVRGVEDATLFQQTTVNARALFGL